MKSQLSLLIFLFSISLSAQHLNFHPALSINGYLETYYCYDINEPTDNNRPGFIYSHNRHNEFNLNLGFIRASLTDSNYRANLALMAGTYSTANLAAEPAGLKNIFEANAGIRLSRKRTLWLDMGIFSSHIGCESAIGKDCWTLTRSLMAETTPYFESGAKLSYTSANEKWNFTALILNGWQRIQRVSGNSLPSFGTQILFKPSGKLTLNSSTFAGTDKADTLRTMRYFHDLYAIFQATERFGIIAGVDIGFEQKAKGSIGYNNWINTTLIARMTLSKKTNLAVRGEYHRDMNGIIAATSNGLDVFGYSVNFDYAITGNILWRIEARGWNNKNEIFMRNNLSVKDDYFFTTSIAISF